MFRSTKKSPNVITCGIGIYVVITGELATYGAAGYAIYLTGWPFYYRKADSFC